MKRIFRLLFALACGWANLASAGEPLIAGVIEAEPWLIRNDDQLTGLIPRFFAELAKRANVQIRIVAEPVPRQIADLSHGQIDLIVVSGPRAFENMIDLGEIGPVDLVAVAPPDHAFAKLSELAGKRVGTPRGGGDFDELTARLKFERYTVANQQSAILMLRDGRLDAIVGVPLAILWNLKQLGLPRGAIGSFIPIWSGTTHLWARSGLAATPGLIKSLDAAAADIRRDGTLLRMMQDYVVN